MVTRRQLFKAALAASVGLAVPWRWNIAGAPARLSRPARVFAAIPGGTLNPADIDKYMLPLVIPPAMPRTDKIIIRGGKNADYYEIAMRQFQQQILPPGLPATTVWGYGSVNHAGTFNYPAFTIEAKVSVPVRVKWINQLVDANGNYLPHLLPVDQTLHWANPPGGTMDRDMHGTDPTRYTGPVPMVPHVHGAHVTQESDGFPEAWFLPAAKNIPSGYATVGSRYDAYAAEFAAKWGVAWTPGSAVYQYPNDGRAGTVWYHDHSLGMTRLNVYAGPAGFYILRGGQDDKVKGKLPGPAPALGDRPGTLYYEIPIAIQDRSFNADGSLFYPDNRAFFEGVDRSQLQVPFTPAPGCDGQPSDVPPIWNPEFFGNSIVVNGRTWPYLDVEQRRYRFRLLNGCQARFLILQLEGGLPFYQIGAEGGFLPAPVQLTQLLMGPAERADVIVDFGTVPVGTRLKLLNLGPDEPFGGGAPGADFEPADAATTGQVIEFRVTKRQGTDKSTPPLQLGLPTITPLPAPTNSRRLSLNEKESANVLYVMDANGNLVADCTNGEPFGPTQALLGTIDANDLPQPLTWTDAVTETPSVGTTETWEIYNFTVDAHPIHIHLVQFQVVNREPIGGGTIRPPESWETGFKDTVIAYPHEITRVKATFDIKGDYVWHCHIVEHEDNEMMRPFRVV